jgi:hypothetical protein
MSADPGKALARALASLDFPNFSGAVSAERLASRPWASGTFSGARHFLSLLLEGPGAGEAAAAFLAGIADHQFALDGHVVADISCGECEHWELSARLTLEALTVVLD